MTNRGGGAPLTDMAFVPRTRIDPPPRSFAADAYDCIMVPIWSDRPNTSLRRDRPRHWRAPLGSLLRHLQSPSAGKAAWRKTGLAVHPPSACSGLKALRNTSSAKPALAKWGAARRQAARAFRSLDPLRALRGADRRRRDEERPFLLRTKNRQKTNSPTHPDRQRAPPRKRDSHE
jgi:hypothetical protein